jgi:hypothetical protein
MKTSLGLLETIDVGGFWHWGAGIALLQCTSIYLI